MGKNKAFMPELAKGRKTHLLMKFKGRIATGAVQPLNSSCFYLEIVDGTAQEREYAAEANITLGCVLIFP